MNNNTQILAEILFILSLIAHFGISFLAMLKITKYIGVFRGANAAILAVLTAILMEVIPIIIFLTGYTPTDVDPARSFIINYDLWPAIIVTEVTSVLILAVVTTGMSPIEDEVIYDEALDLLTELMRRIKEEKSEVREREELTSRTVGSSS